MASWSPSPPATLLMMHQQSLLTNQNQNQIQIHLSNNNNVSHASFVGSNVASFVARLMSLNAHELHFLHADVELMRQLTQTHLLMENKLQVIQSKLLLQQQQQQQQQQQNSYYQQYYQCALSTLADQEQQHQHQQKLTLLTTPQLALDLRLSPSQQHQQQQPQRHPKKLKLCEYQRQLVVDDDASTTSGESSPLGSTSPNSQVASTETSLSPPVILQRQTTLAASPGQDKKLNGGAHLVVPKAAPAGKKYKGEFDEPSPEEVERRQRLLSDPDNYHRAIGSAHLPAECACVLGSQFRAHKSTSSVLTMIDQWRRMDIEQRIKTKWDISDLPLDIPLADIKKFEDLRREASHGRADFGGASKRKPLGIRATRQFLLILYCLWGHPGRDDVMQKEGYCPHCFAKIKKANEQSTLVRVVNHFNMKHRKGANPRLSPHHNQRDKTSSLLNTLCSDNKGDIKLPSSSSSPSPSKIAIPNTKQPPAASANVSQQPKPSSTSKKIKLEPQQQQQQQRHLFADLLLLANSSTSASPTSTLLSSPDPKTQLK